MGLIYTKVLIGGAEVDSDRSTRLRPTRLSVGFEGRDTFEFTEGPGLGPKPSRALGATVEVRLDRAGANRCAFRGQISAVSVTPASGGYVHGYTCLGLQVQIDRIPIMTASEAGTRYVFNAPRDSEDYAASRSGKSVGQIIKAVLNDQSSKLSALGVGLANVNDFETELTQNPLDPVEVSGEGLWNWLQGFMRQWAPNHRAYLEYTDTGAQVRIKDLSDLGPPATLTIGQDLIDPPSISYSVDSCATKVEALGEDDIRSHELSIVETTFEENWTTDDEEDWTLNDFEAEGEAVDEGDITSMTDETVTVTSDSGTRTWTEDYWSGVRQGKILVRDTSISGVESQFLGFVATNEALGAGGSSVITVDKPFDQTGYDRYKLYGRKLSREHVWRRYRPTNADVRAALRSRFPYDVTYRFNAGSAALQGQRYPIGIIIVGGNPFQMLVEVDVGTGDVWFMEPTVTHVSLGNVREDLQIGVVSNEPDDVRVFVPVSNGPLRVTYPESGFDGDAYDWHGLSITLPIRLPSWRDPGAKEQVRKLCEEVWKSVSTPIASTMVTLHGYVGAAWLPLGEAVVLAAKQAPAGAAVDLGRIGEITFAVHAVEIHWGGNDGMRVNLKLSNERRPTTNLDLYTHGARGRYEGGFLQYQGLPQEGQEFGDVDLSALEDLTQAIDHRLNHSPLQDIQASYSGMTLPEQAQAAFNMLNRPMIGLAKQGQNLQAHLPRKQEGPPPFGDPALAGLDSRQGEETAAGLRPIELRPFDPKSKGRAGRPLEASLGPQAQAREDEFESNLWDQYPGSGQFQGLMQPDDPTPRSLGSSPVFAPQRIDISARGVEPKPLRPRPLSAKLDRPKPGRVPPARTEGSWEQRTRDAGEAFRRNWIPGVDDVFETEEERQQRLEGMN